MVKQESFKWNWDTVKENFESWGDKKREKTQAEATNYDAGWGNPGSKRASDFQRGRAGQR